MIDQSHNLKPKIEEMIQTALAAQELFVKAALVDQATLRVHQADCSLVDAEECLKTAFYTDVRPLLLNGAAHTAFRKIRWLHSAEAAINSGFRKSVRSAIPSR